MLSSPLFSINLEKLRDTSCWFLDCPLKLLLFVDSYKTTVAVGKLILL